MTPDLEQEAAELYAHVVARGGSWPADLLFRIAAGETEAAAQLLKGMGIWEDAKAIVERLEWDSIEHAHHAIRSAALGAFWEVLKTWDDPRNWGWRYRLGVLWDHLRHPIWAACMIFGGALTRCRCGFGGRGRLEPPTGGCAGANVRGLHGWRTTPFTT